MKPLLCISFRFIQPFPVFHGRCDGDEPEWPPSPMRAFQALLSAACLRTRGKPLPPEVRSALHVLEVLRPAIVAPRAILSAIGRRAYVPHNQNDLVFTALQRGMEQSSEAYRKLNGSVRTEKNFRPHRIETPVEELPTIHYLYPLDATNADPKELLIAIRPSVRSIHCLGWGIDQVVADAALADSPSKQPTGESWTPTPCGGRRLRVHRSGSLDALVARYDKFLSRLVKGEWTPVPPLTTFDVVSYHRDTDPLPRPFAAFSLLKPDGEGFQPFDSVRYATVVAGMVRHALARAAQEQQPFNWGEEDITSIIHGHNPKGGPARLAADAKRFAYLPLPSIEKRSAEGPPRHVGMIRRVIVAGEPGMGPEIDWVQRALSGAVLIDEQTGEIKAMLISIPASDPNVRRYIGPSSVWTTVTPVILPGFDDHRADKIERLIRKSLLHAGLPPEVVKPTELDWRGVGYMPGLDLASRYRRPRNASEAPVRHVKIRFVDPDGEPLSLQGPLSLGSGRYRGLGLFAACPDGRTPD
ncbi:MAG: type I-U CRISPR-associated protein Cas5/Cas6 [Phycisphaeraceae bacterium]|nr:type I-U CRISPR-associated protein Cas5/Cas6 [Phycisphaeraceae bacterium]